MQLIEVSRQKLRLLIFFMQTVFKNVEARDVNGKLDTVYSRVINNISSGKNRIIDSAGDVRGYKIYDSKSRKNKDLVS